MSKKRISYNEYRGSGPITEQEYSDRFQFSGEGKDTFETVVGILSMDHHREIMTRDYP